MAQRKNSHRVLPAKESMKAAAVNGSVKNFSPISKGLAVHGVETELFNSVEDAIDWGCDFFIQTNIFNQYKSDQDLYKQILATKKPILVIESPVFRFLPENTFKWYRLSWNSYLFPEAIYPFEENSNRWEWMKNEYNLSIKNWHTIGDSIAIALQKFSDSSLTPLFQNSTEKPFIKYTEWLDSVIEQVKDIGYKQIILRPHPLNNPTQIRKLTEKYYKCTVNRDHNLVKNYKCVLTYNSLYAIDCLYNGIPVISLSDTSLQNQFAKFTLKDITNPPKPENREEIFSKLSYCQWREDEVRYGLPFKKLLDLL
jgi:hypothetical protein